MIQYNIGRNCCDAEKFEPVAFARVPAQSLKEEVREKQTLLLFLKFFLLFFDSNKVSATNSFEKITVTGDGSNNSGVCGRSPQHPEANGSLGAETSTLQRFSSFFQKINHFYAYFGLNYCLETWF